MFAWLEQGQTSAKFSVTLRLTCKKARVCFVFFFFLIKYLWKLRVEVTQAQQSVPRLFFSS